MQPPARTYCLSLVSRSGNYELRAVEVACACPKSTTELSTERAAEQAHHPTTMKIFHECAFVELYYTPPIVSGAPCLEGKSHSYVYISDSSVHFARVQPPACSDFVAHTRFRRNHPTLGSPNRHDTYTLESRKATSGSYPSISSSTHTGIGYMHIYIYSILTLRRNTVNEASRPYDRIFICDEASASVSLL
ncbi:hypothetical protein CC80DRAFT_263703 [Byssothecium circinans]|uniref:Uncharacterized protein n=1 Tax=Byssothecium circinans TaxID=147558 RepID=A0A6A5UCX8_9PLEO|nr:hypothetical protein CC80DRAFT_263703 [Byssothecium circinans]